MSIILSLQCCACSKIQVQRCTREILRAQSVSLKDTPEIIVKGARRCRFAAITHVTIRTDQVQAFGFSAIAVMERAFGIEYEASIELRARRNAASFDGYEVNIDQVVQTALDRLS